MTPEDLVSEHIDVIKQEEITLLRQHIHVSDQESVPEILGVMARMLRGGRATASIEVKFNQGGCKTILTEQVTSRELK
jgi:hypothetical protein